MGPWMLRLGEIIAHEELAVEINERLRLAGVSKLSNPFIEHWLSNFF